MGIDHTNAGSDANTEAVEEEPTADRRPPPPPDRPGTDGYPSRADSRNGAAAANDTSTRTTNDTSVEKPDSIQRSQEVTGESSIGEDKSESSTTSDSLESNKSTHTVAATGGEQYETGSSWSDTTTRPETEQSQGETTDAGNAGGQEQLSDSRATLRDSISTTETDGLVAPADAAEQRPGDGAGGTRSAENGEPLSSDTAPSQDTNDIANRPPAGAAETIPVSEAPRESPDVRSNGKAGDTREGMPVSDASEAISPTGLAEDRLQATDKPQSDQPDEAIPIAEVKPDNKTDTHPGQDDLRQKPESTEAIDITPSQRPEHRDAPAEQGNDGNAGDTDTGREQDLGERLMVDGKPLREHLDPVGAAAWSNEIADQPPDPADRTGDRIANTEKDEQPRAEKLRSKFHREGTDAVETAGKAADRVKDVLSHPPTGHSETRTGPSLISAPHDGISVGDTATALIAAGVMIGEFGRLIHGKLVREKGT